MPTKHIILLSTLGIAVIAIGLSIYLLRGNYVQEAMVVPTRMPSITPTPTCALDQEFPGKVDNLLTGLQPIDPIAPLSGLADPVVIPVNDDDALYLKLHQPGDPIYDSTIKRVTFSALSQTPEVIGIEQKIQQWLQDHVSDKIVLFPDPRKDKNIAFNHENSSTVADNGKQKILHIKIVNKNFLPNGLSGTLAIFSTSSATVKFNGKYCLHCSQTDYGDINGQGSGHINLSLNVNINSWNINVGLIPKNLSLSLSKKF